MASAAQKELATQVNQLAAQGLTTGCAAVSAKLGPTAGEVCNTLGKSANDIFAAFSVIEDKLREFGGAEAANKLSKELSGQWGSLTKDIVKDLAVCKYNDNTGSCGGRTATRVAKAILKVRPLNATDGKPGTIPKLGQLSPLMVGYSRAVLFAAFGNVGNANYWWDAYTKNLAQYKGQNADKLKLIEVEKEIVEVAERLQKKWTAAGWEQLNLLKAQQAALKKKLGEPPVADLSEMFTAKITEESLERVKRAAEKRKAAQAAEDAKDEIKLDPVTIGAGAAVLALLVAMGRK